ncbi:hypothetical protein MNBD_NITROSPINAE01-983 [hydrothermal vent metagenome]|uniref:Uncharacterized protein n=1 Tax=hydrothermal vent metagenome TaxID=652676 RepID=A0A3B1C640_9ZZZZ
MRKFLDFYNLVCVAGIAYTIWLGYGAGATGELGRHAISGIVAAIASVLGLTILMFYFIATGSVIKKVVQAGLVDIKLYDKTRRFKMIVFPPTFALILIFSAIPALGAAYEVGKIPLIYHQVLVWGAFFGYIGTYLKARGFVSENGAIWLEAVKASIKADKEKKGKTHEEKDETS